MKRITFVSLALLIMANAFTFNSAQAIDWGKVRNNSVTALKIAGGIAAVACVAYLIKTVMVKTDNAIIQADKDSLANVAVKTSWGPLGGQWSPKASVYWPKTTQYADGSVVTEKVWEIFTR